MKTQLLNLFDYESLAPSYLSPMALDYYLGGAGDEVTLRANRTAFERYPLRPMMLVDVSQRDLRVNILGQSLAMPILIAPTALQCLAHPEGELATARAAEKMGVVMVLSTMSTRSLEDVTKVRQKTPQWFQLYIHRDRALTQALVERATDAGFSALCVTVDAPLLGVRERDRRNQFTLPPGLELANLATMKDLKIPKSSGESGLFTYFAEQIDPSVTWRDLAWLRSLTDLPILVKGILRGDDARRAVDCGIAGIIVSNHGGRQLDGAIASLDALPEVVAGVEGKIPILLDGGIRRGTDVLKALALGAKAVLIGRPILWGLAVAGEAGVTRIIEILRDELDLAMALSGCPTVDSIDFGLISG
jgi:4-hydroxymandelate oxidase